MNAVEYSFETKSHSLFCIFSLSDIDSFTLHQKDDIEKPMTDLIDQTAETISNNDEMKASSLNSELAQLNYIDESNSKEKDTESKAIDSANSCLSNSTCVLLIY